tara:strand:- start:26 stop:445 length:420 start_codon:yes stop_codon:yes gene_type:complete
MKLTESRIKEIIAEEIEAIEEESKIAKRIAENAQYFDHIDSEGGMAKSQLYRMAKYAIMLHDALDDQTQLEAWVQSKITIASEYLGKVKHYLEYEMGLDMMDPEVGVDLEKPSDSACAPMLPEPDVFEVDDEDAYLMES